MMTPRVPNLVCSLTLIYCVFFAVTARGDGFSDAVMSLNPVAYWRLGDSDGQPASDETGNHDGAYVGGVTLGQPGVIGGNSAAHFDEVDDHVLIPDFNYGDEFSVGFFFKQNQLDGSAYQYIFSHNRFAQPNSLNTYFREDDEGTPREIRTIINQSDAAGVSPDVGPEFADGDWHFYTLTVSKQDGSMVYINGELKNTGPQGTEPDYAYDPPTDLFLGGRADLNAARFYGSDDPEQGLLDEVMVFDFPLSATNVSDLYAAVPEPSAIVLTGLGLVMVLLRRHGR